MDLGNVLSLDTGASVLGALGFIVVGLLSCFLGYRLFRFMLAVYGFALGAILGVALASKLLADQGLVTLAVALIAGLFGAGLMLALYHVGVFVVGAVAGGFVASLIGPVLGFDMPTGGILVGAVVVGIVALVFRRAFVVLATAFSGAWATLIGGATLLAGQELALGEILRHPMSWQEARTSPFVLVVLWLALGCAGAIVQFRPPGKR